MHNLQLDYLRGRAGDLSALHKRLLERYKQLSPEGWHMGPNDGYFFQNLTYHLWAARRISDLSELLLDFEWLQAKLVATDVTALVGDFDLLSEDRDLMLVRDAIRLSGHVLDQHETHLGGQLIGRLLSFPSSRIQSLLQTAAKCVRGVWLRPLTQSLTPPATGLIRTVAFRQAAPLTIAVTPDGKQIVSAWSDLTLRTFDIETGNEIKSTKGHSNWISALAIGPDAKEVISASLDGNLIVWELETLRELRTLKGHAGAVLGVAVTRDGRLAVSASEDKTLRVWELQSGRELRTLKGHTNRVWGVALSGDGGFAISASEDRTLKVWELESGREIRTLDGHSAAVSCVAMSADGTRAVSGSFDNELRLWDVKSGRELCIMMGHSRRITGVAVTKDGQHAVTSSADATLVTWALETASKMRTLRGHSGPVLATGLTPDSPLRGVRF